MLDIKRIRENPEAIKEGIKKKGADPKLIDELILIDRNRRRLQTDYEKAQSELNSISKEIAQLHGQQKIDAINRAANFSDRIRKIKPELEQAEKEYLDCAYQIPNPPEEDVILGQSDKDNTVNRKVGEPPKFDFQPSDHVDLGQKYDLIDIERGVKIAGSRSYFIKNELVILEFALVQYVFDILTKEGFVPMIPPVLLNRQTVAGAGYLPAGEDEIYKTQDDSYLAGTAEQPLAGYHQGEIIEADRLPLRYAGFSSCFRREAGSYGKDVRGILRVHQFDKVEMFSFTKPADSEKEHEYLVTLEEKIVKGLKIPYQIVNICTGDLGAPASKKFDIECYLPGEDRYRETHSCSNCTDFQSRRLNIRYRDHDGKVDFLHTLNGTAVAIGRMLIAIIENYQKEDKIVVPEVLQKWSGFGEIRRKK
jgi:seryl-tRNA synthetase